MVIVLNRHQDTLYPFLSSSGTTCRPALPLPPVNTILLLPPDAIVKGLLELLSERKLLRKEKSDCERALQDVIFFFQQIYTGGSFQATY